MSRSQSQKLRILQSQRGATVHVRMGTHKGQEVTFSPRYPTDKAPWVLKAGSERFSGDECKAVSVGPFDKTKRGQRG